MDAASFAVVGKAVVDFDADFPQYKTSKGVHSNPKTMEVWAPVAMWLEAVDLLFARLAELRDDTTGAPISRRIRYISGACQQHGSVFWNTRARALLRELSAESERPAGLVGVLGEAFAWERSPNWQDRSTQAQCDAFDGVPGLVEISGSRAHHRFTGPQILKLKQTRPEVYEQTAHISLVSSFLATVLVGDGEFQPLDRADVCGMNLWDIRREQWSPPLVSLIDSDASATTCLVDKLGGVQQEQTAVPVARYFATKHNLHAACEVVTPFTGDNPATVLAQALGAGDAMVSLGTSTTALVVTHAYRPSAQYHLFAHPVERGAYMGMVCYSNGALAREQVRDAVNAKYGTKGWTQFDAILGARAASRMLMGYRGADRGDKAKIGIYFPVAEIVPPVGAQTVHCTWQHEARGDAWRRAERDEWSHPEDDVMGIVESQGLSVRARLGAMLAAEEAEEEEQEEHASPEFSSSGARGSTETCRARRVYFVGGASANAGLCRALARVLAPAEGAFRAGAQDACACGAALKSIYYMASSAEKGGVSVEQQQLATKSTALGLGASHESYGEFIERCPRAVEALEKSGDDSGDDGVVDGVVDEYGLFGRAYAQTESALS